MFAIVPVVLFAALAYLTVFVDFWFIVGAVVLMPIVGLVLYLEYVTVEVVEDDSFTEDRRIH